MTKIRMKCVHCGSERLLQDAWAEWSFAAQEWVLHSTQANFWCQGCDGETSYPNNEEAEEPVTLVSAPRTPAECQIRFTAAIWSANYYLDLLKKDRHSDMTRTWRLFANQELAEAVGWASR